MTEHRRRIKPLAKSADAKEREAELLVEFALGQKKEFLQALLRDKGLHFSGTKEILRERVFGYLEEGLLSAEELANFLDSVEGWGNQTIYLYRAQPATVNLWRRDITTLTKAVQAAGYTNLLNKKKTLLLPEEPQLSSILIDNSTASFMWVEKHEWYQRTQELDKDKNGDIVFRAFRRNLERRVTRFEIDLKTGDSILTIPKISNLVTVDDDAAGGKNLNKYEKLRTDFEEALDPMVGINSFRRFSLKKAIENLQDSAEVMRRENVYETPEGSQIRLLSSASDRDTRDDIRVESLRGKIPADTPGTVGNYKWLPNSGSLEREITVKLYGIENRIAIGIQCTEQEVKYVLSRIRVLGQ